MFLLCFFTVQLLTKKEVQLSLSEEQKEYQRLIQDISSKLHLLNTKLSLQPSVSHLNIETHIIEHNVSVAVTLFEVYH